MSKAITSLTEYAQGEIMHEMHVAAQALADNSDGLFVAYEPNLERFPYQSISLSSDHYVIRDPRRLSVEQLTGFGTLMDSRVPSVVEAVDKYDEGGALSGPARTVQAGHSVFLAGPHSEFIDIARDTLIVSNRFRRQNIAHRTGLIAAKPAIDFLGVNLAKFNVPLDASTGYLESLGIPVEEDGTATLRNVARVIVDCTYLTFAASQTMENLRTLQRRALQAHNSLALSALKSDIKNAEKESRNKEGEGGYLLAAAFTGSTIKELDMGEYDEGNHLKGFYNTIPPVLPEGDGSVEVLPHISSRTPDVVGGTATYAFAVLPSMEESRVAIDGAVQYIRRPRDVDTLAVSLLGLLDQVDPGKRRIYDRGNNLPQVRRTIT